MELRALVGHLVGKYHDSDPAGGPGPYHLLPAISHGHLPESVTATGLEVHVDDLTDVDTIPTYMGDAPQAHLARVFLVEHDNTPPGALRSARERIVTTYRVQARTVPPVDREGIRHQVIVEIPVSR